LNWDAAWFILEFADKQAKYRHATPIIKIHLNKIKAFRVPFIKCGKQEAESLRSNNTLVLMQLQAR
jgi:hypothetical protein